jgi:hypothetical protein
MGCIRYNATAVMAVDLARQLNVAYWRRGGLRPREMPYASAIPRFGSDPWPTMSRTSVMNQIPRLDS